MTRVADRSARRHAVTGGAALLFVIAIASMFFPPHGVEAGALLIWGLLILLTAYRPQWALVIFVLGLPLHNLFMATLFHATGSVTFVKLMQPWKEVVLATAFIRALVPVLRDWWISRRVRLTLLDGLVCTFVAFCAVSVVLPNHLIPLTGRLYGFRDLVLPLVVYVVGRLAPLSSREMKAVAMAIGADVALLGVAAVGERVVWGQGLLRLIDYGTYLHDFLGQTFPIQYNIPFTYYTSGWLPRTGSLTLGPLDLANLLLVTIPVLVAISGLQRMQPRRLFLAAIGVTVFLGGCALVLSFGRQSLVLLPVSLLVMLVLGGLRHYWPVVGVVICGMALGVVLVLVMDSYVLEGSTLGARQALSSQGLITLMQMSPGDLAAGQLSPNVGNDSSPISSTEPTPAPEKTTLTGAADQLFESSAGADNSSTQGHLSSLKFLAGLIAQRPLGYGIGTAGQVGSRFHTGINGETSYLTVGVELGIFGLLLYIALFAGAMIAAWRAMRSRLPALHRAVFLGALIGWIAIAADGVFAEVTLDLFVMYVLFWLSGAAVTQAGASHVVPGDSGIYHAARPLHIAMDVQALQTARTGVRTYLDEMLSQFDRPDMPHKVTYLHGPRRLPNRVRIFRVLNQAMYFGWLHVWLPLRLALGTYDVLFSPEYMTPLWVPIARVVVAHDAAFLRRPQDYNGLWLWMFKWLTMPAIRRADAVIVPSSYTATELAGYGHVSKSRMVVVPLGGAHSNRIMQVDGAEDDRVLGRYGLQQGAYIAHVGVLERRKNLVTLVQAFGILRERGMPQYFKLVLVGQPGPRPDLNDSMQIQRAIEELHLEDHVILTGHVSIEERNILYTQAGVIAIPSLLEGFGIPVLEAFAAQVPLVVSNATSLPEVAGDGALLFDPSNPHQLADCIAAVLTSPELRNRLIDTGRQRLQMFSWERTAAETMKVFEAAVVHRFAPAQRAQSLEIHQVSSEPAAVLHTVPAGKVGPR